MPQTNLEFHPEVKFKKPIKHTDHNHNRRVNIRYNVAKDCVLNGVHCQLMDVSIGGLGIDISDDYKFRVGDMVTFSFILSNTFFCCAKGMVVRVFLIKKPGISKVYKEGHLGLGIQLFYTNENFKEFIEFLTVNSPDTLELVE